MRGDRSPFPGEARVGVAFGRLLEVRDVTIAVPDRTPRVEAIVDTGSTYRVISRRQGALLGLSPEDRLETHHIRGVGGAVGMDRHRLEYVQVDTARVYNVNCLVGDAMPGLMLVGMSFIERFQITLDSDAARVLFRARRS